MRESELIMNENVRAIIERLEERDTLQPLSPQRPWDPSLTEQIEALDLPGGDHDAGVIALVASLHLRNDDLVVSHGYAQEIEHDATGAYWHGIMHRMEQDYPNASYWFMRAGDHPVLATIKQRTAGWLEQEQQRIADAVASSGMSSGVSSRLKNLLLELQDASGGWTPHTFNELVELQELGEAGSSEQVRSILEHIQHIEVTELFKYTLDNAQK